MSRFLDVYLYDRCPTGASFSSIQRVEDKEAQLAGVDVRFTGLDGTVYHVDEKAQLYYLNKDLPTFAFEIQYMREGREALGWLCNEELLTDLYLLIWHSATPDRPQQLSWDQFTRADCLLVQKRRILEMLEQEGLTLERMCQEATRLRRDGHKGKVRIDGLRGIYYYVSDPESYQEAPINLVIAKSRLMKIAQRRYIVTPEGVEIG